MGTTLYSLLQKMRDADPDFRIVATDDLMKGLTENTLRIAESDERDVVQAVLRLLADTNGEVQNRAVQCLLVLIPRIKDAHIKMIIKELCQNMMAKKKGAEQLRDVSIMGIKGVIQQLPASSTAAADVCQDLVNNLIAAISEEKDQGTTLEALDVLAEVLARYGNLLGSQHKTIQDMLLKQLTHTRPAVRKRAIHALARLVPVESDQLFTSLLSILIERLKTDRDDELLQTTIQAITAITRNVGHRMGAVLGEVFSVLEKKVAEADEDVDLREACIQCLESFIFKCPNSIVPYLQKCIEIGLQYVGWDPNYEAMSGDEGDMSEDDASDADDEDLDDDEEWDDDMSWKVRRASSKMISAIAATRPELLSALYSDVVPVLINRFKEREENVRLEVFSTLQTLLRTTKLVSQARDTDEDAMDVGDGPQAMLNELIPAIVKGIVAQLKDKSNKSMKTKQTGVQLLRDLVNASPRCLNDDALLTPLLEALKASIHGDKSNSNLRMDTLAFLLAFLNTHAPQLVQRHSKLLVEPICLAVQDSFYKTASEGLNVCAHLVRSLRPIGLGGGEDQYNFEADAAQLFNVVNGRFVVTDIDQEVKDRAMVCMARLIANMGDALKIEISGVLPHLLKRLQNEITRLTAVRSLTMIAESPLKIDITPIIGASVEECCKFLKKEDRQLRLSTLQCLGAIVEHANTGVPDQLFAQTLGELTPMVSDSDLQVTEYAITVTTNILAARPALAKAIEKDAPILPATLILLQSALLQGGALSAVINFFAFLGNSYGDPLDLLKQLTAPAYNFAADGSGAESGGGLALPKQGFVSMSKCVGAVARSSTLDVSKIVKQFMSDIQSPGTSDSVKLLAFLCVGDIGSGTDLSGQVDLKVLIDGAASWPSEDVRAAGAQAIGHICAGNLHGYLPVLLKELKGNAKRQYMLLHALKECIQYQARTTEGLQALHPFVPEMWGILFEQCEIKEEGMRNVVADCLGKLTLIEPDTLLPQLQERLTSSDANVRSTVVTAVKFTIMDKPHAIDRLLRPLMEKFLSHIQDPDLNVRRVALNTLNSVAHNKPQLIAVQLQNILPLLYAETVFKPELVRKVQVGPFPVEFDDGEDIRKAAFECMYTLLDYCVSMMVMDVFITHVITGMKDKKDDIQMLTHLMLLRLVSIIPSAVLNRLDEVVDALHAAVSRKPSNKDAIKQELEKIDDLVRSAMRALNGLKKIPDAESNAKLVQLLANIQADDLLRVKWETVQKDGESGTRGAYEPMDTN